jgi:hypothetical protein
MVMRSWEDIRPGWYEIVIRLDEENPHTHKIEILEWIAKMIEMHDRHCIYTWTDEIVKIKFRYQRDFIMARLRW